MKRAFTSLLLVAFMIYISAGLDVYVSAANVTTTNEIIAASTESEGLQSETPNLKGPNLFSETAVLIDVASGQVLFEKQMNKKMFPASITKILTALLAIENGRSDQRITMSERAVFSIERGSSHIALDMDEQITLEQAIYGISIASGNDAANGIAETIGGTLEGFAEMMNQRAKEAGAINSNFVNAHGLPDDSHVTTAYDMGMIMRACVQEPEFLKYFSEKLYEIPPTNKQTETRFLHNANCLVNGTIVCDGIIASKTGYTNAAGNTLVSAAVRNGRTLVAVVMKSSGRNDKFDDTNALFDYGFESFREITIPAEEISKSITGHTAVDVTGDTLYYSSSDIDVLLHEDVSEDSIEIVYELPEESEASTGRGQAFVRVEEDQAEGLMYEQLAVVELESATDENFVAAENGDSAISGAGDNDMIDGKTEQAGPAAKLSQFFRRLLPVLGGLAVLVIIYFVLRERRRRRRRRKLERLRRQYNIKPYHVDYHVDRSSKML